MRVLVAISILAFLALLWASIAIFRHIQRTRRRRRRVQEASYNLTPTPAPIVIAPPPQPVVPEITFTDPEAPLPEVAFTDPQAPIREPITHAYQPYLRQADLRPVPSRSQPAATPVPLVVHAPPPEIAATEEFVDTLPPPAPPNPAAPREPGHSPLRSWPHFGFTPSPPAQPFRPHVIPAAEPELALAAEQALEDHQASGRTPQPPPEPLPYAAPPLTESSTSVTPARSPIQIQPPAPAVKPLYPSSYPTLAENTPESPPPLPPRPADQPLRRADWTYFNKDMGDLSDPAPAGSRPRVRTHNSD